VEALEARLAPAVYSPAQIRHAYGFDQVAFRTSTGAAVAADGRGQTIAIVEAYDDPAALHDLQAFDAHFGLPNPPSFRKVSQTGSATALPRPDVGWAQESALDVEWAHAIAPKANILLVEATDTSVPNLLRAVDYARRQPGVSVVSLSWGSAEFPAEGSYDYHFTTPAGHAGVTFVASSGDNGGRSGPVWPAVSPSVLGVGGTSLNLLNGNYSYETGWAGSGGGVSAYLAEPAFQVGAQSSGRRTSPDVGFDANPATGFSVYDSYGTGGTHWFVLGGTSAGAPQWAALFAIANQGRALAGRAPLDGRSQTLPAVYALPASDFHDILSGTTSAGAARAAYDLLTGRGTPRANLVIGALVGYLGGKSFAPATGSVVAVSAAARPAASAAAPAGEPMSVGQFGAAFADPAPAPGGCGRQSAVDDGRFVSHAFRDEGRPGRHEPDPGRPRWSTSGG
jgi:hypothetical protein